MRGVARREAAAEVVGRSARHADAAAIFVLACPPDKLRAKILDDAGLGERLDEGILLVDRPAVAAGAEGGGFEGNEWFVFAVFHEPYWNTEWGL